MKTSRFGLFAGVAVLLATPGLAQTAEPPAGGTPPAGTDTQTPGTTTPPTAPADTPAGQDDGMDKPDSKDKDSKEGAEAPRPQ